MQTAEIKRAALYLRVSTSQQDTDAQRAECAAYAIRENLPIFTNLEDITSGSAPWRDRSLFQLIDPALKITDIIVYEYSRIGRDMVDTLEFLKVCNERDISVHITKSKTVVRADIGGKVIATVMSLAAEIERDLLRSRTKDALKERRRKIKEDGGFMSAKGNYTTKLGRPFGSTGSSKLAHAKEDIIRLANAKVTATAIGRMYDCDARTVRTFIEQLTKGKK